MACLSDGGVGVAAGAEQMAVRRAPEAAPACGERNGAREEEASDDATAEIVWEAADPVDSFNVAGAGSDGVGEGGGGRDGQCGMVEI